MRGINNIEYKNVCFKHPAKLHCIRYC